MPTPPASPQAVPTHDAQKRLGTLVDKLLSDVSPELSAREIVRRSHAREYPATLSNASLSYIRNGDRLPRPEVLNTLLAVLDVSDELRRQARYLRDLAANPPADLDHDHAAQEDSTAHESHPRPHPQPARSPGGAPAIDGRPSRSRHLRLIATAVMLALLLDADTPPVPPPPLGPPDAVALAKGHRAKAEFYRAAHQIKLQNTRSDGYTAALDLRVDGRHRPPEHDPDSQYRNTPQGRVLNPPMIVNLNRYGPWTTLQFRACASSSPPSITLCGEWVTVTSRR